MTSRLPWYARALSAIGRPVVLLAALALSAPGEYELAVLAGWSPSFAWLMPLVLSAYAVVAAVFSATTGSRSARTGAWTAMALALSAQMTAHLIASGHVQTSAWLVAAVSAAPPLVAAHMAHLAAMPGKPESAADAQRKEVPRQPLLAPEAPAQPVPEPPEPVVAAEVAPDVPESGPDSAPDTDSADEVPPDTVPDMRTGRPTLADIRKVITANGSTMTGQQLAAHFGVSDRTGRRYLAMAAY